MTRVFGMAVVCAALLGACVSAAPAHTLSESHSSWRIDGASVRLVFTAPALEANRLAGPGADSPSDEQLTAYLAPRVGARSGGAECAGRQGGKPLSAAAGYRRIEFQFDCPSADAISAHTSAFFDLVPTHVNFAQIQTGDGVFIEEIMTAGRQSVDAARYDNEPGDGILGYFILGVKHILGGPDHQAFLLGLFLISKNLRDLVFVVTGFTLGHSLTLALAVTGVVRPHAEYIDALVGLTIALIAAENVSLASGRPRWVAACVGAALLAMAGGAYLGLGGLPPPLTLGAALFSANYLMISGSLLDGARFRLVVTMVFGLVHGFGFAADLLEMRIPPGQLFGMLAGFNLGVEAGQLSLVFLALGATRALVRMRLAAPRALVTDCVSAALMGLGTYWLVSRAYG